MKTLTSQQPILITTKGLLDGILLPKLYKTGGGGKIMTTRFFYFVGQDDTSCMTKNLTCLQYYYIQTDRFWIHTFILYSLHKISNQKEVLEKIFTIGVLYNTLFQLNQEYIIIERNTFNTNHIKKEEKVPCSTFSYIKYFLSLPAQWCKLSEDH